MTPIPVGVPDPYACEYGPLRDEVFEFIDRHTDQEKLSGGKVVHHFEW